MSRRWIDTGIDTGTGPRGREGHDDRAASKVSGVPVASGDRGGVVIWVALMMVVLLGAGALVIDLGAAQVEGQRLRNGAEAASLAIAQDCVDGGCGPIWSTATAYAERNDPDGAMAVVEICGDAPDLGGCGAAVPEELEDATGWVRVRTRTATPEGGDQVRFVLAPIMNSLMGATLTRGATAAWGAAGSGRVAPLAVSLCEFQALGGDAAAGIVPSGIRTVTFHGVGSDDTESCVASTSGADLPGGFGWLSSQGCRLEVTVGTWLAADPGTSPDQDCRDDLVRWRSEPIAIVLYDAERAQGAGGEYRVAGLAGLEILGYRFPGERWPAGFRCEGSRGNRNTCIRARFSTVTITGGGFGGDDYGARTVRLVG